MMEIRSTVARCRPTSPVVCRLRSVVGLTCHDTTAASFVVGPSLVAGPVIWNSLPAHLCHPSLSSDSFVPALKTHLHGVPVTLAH